LRSWQEVVPLKEWALEKAPFVAVIVVVGRTYCIVVVMGMMIHILMILDPE